MVLRSTLCFVSFTLGDDMQDFIVSYFMDVLQLVSDAPFDFFCYFLLSFAVLVLLLRLYFGMLAFASK